MGPLQAIWIHNRYASIVHYIIFISICLFNSYSISRFKHSIGFTDDRYEGTLNSIFTSSYRNRQQLQQTKNNNFDARVLFADHFFVNQYTERSHLSETVRQIFQNQTVSPDPSTPASSMDVDYREDCFGRSSVSNEQTEYTIQVLIIYLDYRKI